jgi:3-keto-5-aminohexanoate cleavage enzyme
MKSGDVHAKPLVISAAITGSVTARAQTPHLPVSAQEIIESSLGAIAAGAAIVHIHVREADGTPSARVALYEEVFAGIRAQSDGLICATTGSGAGRFTDDERLAALQLNPDIASFDAGSMNFGERVFINSPAFLRRLAASITTRGILPEIECFDVGMIGNALRLGAEGLLPGEGKPWWFQLCLGVVGGAPADPSVLTTMRHLLPEGAEWSVLGVGRWQLPVALMALGAGGHVRTGLEDNVYMRAGEYAVSNAELVQRIVGLAREVGRPVATPAETRVLLGLRTGAP